MSGGSLSKKKGKSIKKSNTRKSQGFRFQNIYQEQQSVKKDGHQSEELCIIDKDAYIKGTHIAASSPTPIKPAKTAQARQNLAQAFQQDDPNTVHIVDQKDLSEPQMVDQKAEGNKANERDSSDKVIPEDYCNMTANKIIYFSQSLSPISNGLQGKSSQQNEAESHVIQRKTSQNVLVDEPKNDAKKVGSKAQKQGWESQLASRLLEGATISHQYLEEGGLKDRIQEQLRQLIQQEPINLVEGECLQNKAGVPKMLSFREKKAETSSLCEQCQQIRSNEHNFSVFVRAQLQGEAAIDLNKLYLEQQTFYLINGWNPHLQQDKLRKLVVLQGQNYLQKVIRQNQVAENQLHTIWEDHELSKIVWAEGTWYGIFRSSGRTGKQYYYVNLQTAKTLNRDKILGYLSGHKEQL